MFHSSLSVSNCLAKSRHVYVFPVYASRQVPPRLGQSHEVCVQFVSTSRSLVLALPLPHIAKNHRQRIGSELGLGAGYARVG